MTTPLRRHVVPRQRLLVAAAFHSADYPLRRSTLLDSGASLHVFNDRTRLRNFRAATYGESIFAGDTEVPILGWGTATVRLKTPSGRKIPLALSEVAHCEGFKTNLVSLRRLNHLGYYFHNKDNTLRRYKNDRVVGEIESHYNQFVLEFVPYDAADAAPRGAFPAHNHIS